MTSLCAARAGEATADRGSARFVREWGSEGTEPGQFHFPIGIAVDRSNVVFETDFYNDRVQVFDGEGKLLRLFPVAPHPGGIAVDATGEVYISHFGIATPNEERKPDRITVYRSDGAFLREWGSTGTVDSQFDMPGGVALGRDGRVYVADQTNRRVQVFDREGRFLSKWGEYGTEPGQFGGNVSRPSRVGGPQFVAVDSAGNVYTTEGSVGRVQKFTADGEFLRAWGDNEDKPGSFGGELAPFRLRGPVGICVDRHDCLWVSAVSGRVQRFSRDGEFLEGFGEEPGTGPGEFQAPHGVAADSRDHLYVVDAYNHRIQQFAISPPR